MISEKILFTNESNLARIDIKILLQSVCELSK